MGAIKAAIGDGAITFMWMFVSSLFGFLTSLIATALGVQHLLWANLAITTSIIFVNVFLFNFLGQLFGGASFNPTGNAAFYALGLGDDSLFSMALRFPAQVAGAVGGLLAVMEVMPPQYKHMLVGPALKVDVHSGAIAEGLLTFLITFAVLFILQRGPKNAFLQSWLLALVTIVLVVAGSDYTGPSMNPVNAFGWAYINKWHNTWDQLYVYWICPFLGAILASWLFRLVFPPSAPKRKQKKA